MLNIDIYGPQKKSWVMSVTLQSAAVLLLFTAASSKVEPQKVARFVTLFDPAIPVPQTKSREGGGGDGSVLPARPSGCVPWR
jgi:hypothetical protein